MRRPPSFLTPVPPAAPILLRRLWPEESRCPPSGVRAARSLGHGIEEKVAWGHVAARPRAVGSLPPARLSEDGWLGPGRSHSLRRLLSRSQPECGCLTRTGGLCDFKVRFVLRAKWCEAVNSPRYAGEELSRTRYACQVDEVGQVQEHLLSELDLCSCLNQDVTLIRSLSICTFFSCSRYLLLKPCGK